MYDPVATARGSVKTRLRWYTLNASRRVKKKKRPREELRGLFRLREPMKDHVVGSIRLNEAVASLLSLSGSLAIIPPGLPMLAITYSG